MNGQRNIKTLSYNHCRSGKEISVTYSECALVTLGIQHAITCAILSSVVYPDVQYFSTLSHKRHDFQNVNGHQMCFNFLHSFCLKYFSF
jgi:hypothetical protein